jgi:hypothetical protein
MNLAAHDLITRPFGEIVDDLLTAVVGGVVNEPILFDLKAMRYGLAEPAAGIRSVTGTFSQEHYQFRNEVDFTFDLGSNALVWLDKHDALPDDDTVIYVDYFRRFSNSPISDINVGSVTRTLMEAIARETALVYASINQAYLMGFIDTATGKSLDYVVAILGVERKGADFAEGLVTFFRDNAAGDGNITIPEGVVAVTDKATAAFVTTQMRTLQRGQARIDVPVRAMDAFKGPAGAVAAGLITTLQLPIAGIGRVSNFDPTVLGAAAETDEELRIRAKAVIRGLGKATLAALRRAVTEERAGLNEIWDPNGPPGKAAPPGFVKLLVDVSPGRFESVRNALEETRAAGVKLELLAKYLFIRPRMEVPVTPGLSAAGKIKVVQQVIDAIRTYTETLKAGEPALASRILDAIVKDEKTKVADVLNAGDVKPKIKDVIVQTADLSAPTPSAERVARSSQLLDKDGHAISALDDSNRESFSISAVVDGERDWTIALDMDASDIALKE